MAQVAEIIDAGRTPWRLWWSLVAGFAAWSADLGLSYILEQHSCSTGHHYVLHVISLLCLLVAFSGFATGFSEFKQLPGNTTEEGGSHFDRARFEALLGMAFSLSFAIVIIAGSLPRWLLSACE